MDLASDTAGNDSSRTEMFPHPIRKPYQLFGRFSRESIAVFAAALAPELLSLEMLDLILEGRAVSTSYMYDSWNGYNYKMADLVKGTRELASFAKSSDKSVLKHYEKVAAIFFADPIE